MNIFEELKTDALNAWQAFEGDVAIVAHRIGVAAKHDVPVLWKQFGPIALQLVLGLAGAAFDSFSGGTKLALAASALVMHAKEQSLEIAETDAPALVQQAYDALAITNPIHSPVAVPAPAHATADASVHVPAPLPEADTEAPPPTVAPAHGQAVKP